MAHPRDFECEYCGAPCGFRFLTDNPFEYGTYVSHICPNKPPITADEGAAVAFGIIGMANAIIKMYEK